MTYKIACIVLIVTLLLVTTTFNPFPLVAMENKQQMKQRLLDELKYLQYSTEDTLGDDLPNNDSARRTTKVRYRPGITNSDRDRGANEGEDQVELKVAGIKKISKDKNNGKDDDKDKVKDVRDEELEIIDLNWIENNKQKP